MLYYRGNIYVLYSSHHLFPHYAISVKLFTIIAFLCEFYMLLQSLRSFGREGGRGMGNSCFLRLANNPEYNKQYLFYCKVVYYIAGTYKVLENYTNINIFSLERKDLKSSYLFRLY